MFVKLYRIKEQPEQLFEKLFCRGTQIGNKLTKEEIVRENYDLLFSGEIPDGNLEHIFHTFNMNMMEYGMSVSDVVEVVASAHIKPGFYFCDNFSWTEVTW